MATAQFVPLGDLPPELKAIRFQFGLDVPVPKELSHVETQAECTRYAALIFKDYTSLAMITKRFEAVIQKRWQKKTRKQRANVLLQAWPSMPPTHRPDMEALRSLDRSGNRPRASVSAFLWPYINQEDLLQGPLLPLYIHSRSRNFPDVFFSHDVEAAKLAHSGWDARPQSEHFVISPMGKRTPRSYAKLHAPRVRDCSKDYLAHRSSIGLVGLEVQQRIYQFLVNVSRIILCDMKQPWLCYPSRRSDISVSALFNETWSSLSRTALQAPYRPPFHLDLERFCELVSAKRSEQEDHVWMLREDPGYFASTIKEWSEHRTEVVTNERGQTDPICRTAQFWASSTHFVLSQSVGGLFFWSILQAHLDDLVMMFPSFDALDWSVRLPRRLEHQFQLLERLLSRMINGPLHMLKLGYPGSPLARKYYRRVSNSTVTGFAETEFRGQRKSTPGKVDLLLDILQSPHLDSIHGIHSMVEEIQHFLDTNDEGMNLMSSWVLGQFSDVALLSELMHQLFIFYPWSIAWREFDYDKGKLDAELEPYWDVFKKAFNSTVFEYCHGTHTGEEAVSTDPSDGRFEYPLHKRVTKQSTEQMVAAERELDIFWAGLDARFKPMGFDSLWDALHLFTTEKRELRRTNPWSEEETLRLSESGGARPREHQGPFHALPHGVDAPENLKTHLQAEPRVKEKTKGSSDESDIHVANGEQTVESAISHDQFEVSKRAYKTFSTVFYRSSTSNSPLETGELTWTDFKYAMICAGFTAEHLRGSVWVFRPHKHRCAELFGAQMPTRSIQFHAPHVRGGKMPHVMARHFGRSLNRAFGWDCGTFTCK